MMNALAWWHLNRSGELPSTAGAIPACPGIQRLRIWDDAMSFGDPAEPMTLTVFEPFVSGESDPLVRRAIWTRHHDLRVLSKAVKETRQVVPSRPTIVVQDASLPVDLWKALLDEASAFQVPVVWESSKRGCWLDVGSVGFEFFNEGSPAAVLRLEWSANVPKQWEPVVAWVGRVRKLLEDCLRAAGKSTSSDPSQEQHPLWDHQIDGGTT
jgi:hypothetical protein